ncbi:MAG: hypothetical protein ABIO70_14850 [Pseudomonadota bacterium]
MELLPDVGLGPVRLGMRPAEVRRLLGDEQTWEEWMGGNLNDALLYPGLRLHFDACGPSEPLPHGRLVWIVVHGRPDVTLIDRPITAWTRPELEAALRHRGEPPVSERNGDLAVRGRMWFSFDDVGNLCHAEIEAPVEGSPR